jgi:hypothetical protein
MGHDLHKCDFCNVTKLHKLLLQMHSSLDEHLYEINYIYLGFFKFYQPKATSGGFLIFEWTLDAKKT